jgi:hypothetical protein
MRRNTLTGMLTSAAAALSLSRSSFVQRRVMIVSFSMSSFVNGLNTPSTEKDQSTQKTRIPFLQECGLLRPDAAPVAAPSGRRFA